MWRVNHRKRGEFTVERKKKRNQRKMRLRKEIKMGKKIEYRG